MKVIKNSEVGLKAWDEFLVKSEFSSPFQTKSFYDLINSIENLKANVYAVEENGVLLALCVVTIQKEVGIKGFFSRRGIIYGGPVLINNGTEVEFLLKHISKELNNVIYIETRNFGNFSEYRNSFKNAGWEYEPYLNFHLDCANEQTVWNKLNSNRQRQIKKAFKEGVVFEEARTTNDVKEFYEILSHLYKAKVKKPLFPINFFEKFVTSNVGKILLVKKNDKVIGGIAAPIYNNKSIYELYICGLDQEYKECSPSVMATYAAIQYAFKNNLKRFDFMGAGKPDDDYGVRSFKEKFGGDLVENGRFIKINNRFLYNLGSMAIRFLSRRKVKK